MTDLPPPPPDEELDSPWDEDGFGVSETFGTVDVQALLAFTLAVLSMASFSLLNGTTYFFTSLDATTDYKTRSVLAALLGAAFALLPVVLGWRVSARVLADDAKWIATLARTAVLLGLLSVALRLVLAVVAAASSDPRSIGRF